MSTASLIARGGFRYPGTVFWTVYSISAVSHPTKKNQSFKHIPSPIWCLRTPPLTKKNVTLWSPKLVYLGLCQTMNRFWKSAYRRIGFPDSQYILVLESPMAYRVLSEALCAGNFHSDSLFTFSDEMVRRNIQSMGEVGGSISLVLTVFSILYEKALALFEAL